MVDSRQNLANKKYALKQQKRSRSFLFVLYRCLDGRQGSTIISAVAGIEITGIRIESREGGLDSSGKASVSFFLFSFFLDQGMTPGGRILRRGARGCDKGGWVMQGIIRMHK